MPMEKKKKSHRISRLNVLELLGTEVQPLILAFLFVYPRFATVDIFSAFQLTRKHYIIHFYLCALECLGYSRGGAQKWSVVDSVATEEQEEENNGGKDQNKKGRLVKKSKMQTDQILKKEADIHSKCAACDQLLPLPCAKYCPSDSANVLELNRHQFHEAFCQSYSLLMQLLLKSVMLQVNPWGVSMHCLDVV